MKYPLEFIEAESKDLDPAKSYPIYVIQSGGVTALAKRAEEHISLEHYIGCRLSGRELRNGHVIDIDESDLRTYSHVDQARLSQIRDLQGNPLGEQIRDDALQRHATSKSTTLKLGHQYFNPMVVLSAELEIRSKNKKPVEDPDAILEIKVKAKVWSGTNNNWVLTYDQTNHVFMWDNKPFHPDNEGDLLKFVKERLEEI